MKKTNFLNDLFEILNGYTFDKIEKLDSGTYYISDTDTSEYWNMFLVEDKFAESDLAVIEEKFKTYKRLPSMYFSTESDETELQKYLTSNGYKLSHKDSFMFHNGLNIELNNDPKIKLVENEESLKEFLETADNCYIKNDPQGPYGTLDEFLKTIKIAWHNLFKNGKILLYTIFNENNEPVAVAVLSLGNNIGYITTVGSLPAVRGQGYGKLATLHCVQESVKRGNKYHCLGTEKNNYPYEFYKRLGFTNDFTSVCYVKNSSKVY